MLRLSLLRILLAAAFLPAALIVSAQLHVAKNDATCLYGLKNAKGQWIVPAGYLSIEPLSDQRFLASDGSHKSVFAANGSAVVPPVYDDISYYAEGYLVTRAGKKGALHFDGTVLFPDRFSAISYEPSRNGRDPSEEGQSGAHYYLYETLEDTVRTTMTDAAGNVLIDRMTGYLLPFDGRRISAVGLAGSGRTVNGNARLVRADGKPARPETYTAIEVRSSCFVVEQDWKTGYVDFSNNMLLPPQYDVRFIRKYTAGRPCPNGGSGLFLLRDSLGRLGLLDGNFRIVLPPTYSSVTEMSALIGTKVNAFLVGLDGKYGVISTEGKMLIPIACDTIIARRLEVSKHEEPVFFCRSDGKLSMLDITGRPWIEGTYDHFFWMSPRLFVLQDRECVTILEAGDSAPVVEYPALFARRDSDSLLLYRWDDRLIVLKQETSGDFSMEETLVKRTGNLYILPRRDYASEFVIYHTDGTAVSTRGLHSIGQPAGHYLPLYYKEGGTLLNTHTGKLVLPAFYRDVDVSRIRQNSVWVQDRRSSKWMVFDTNGVQRSNVVFDKRTSAADLAPAYSGGFAGLINEELEWVLQPAYQAVEAVSPATAAVYTKGGKYGIVDTRGRPVVDTVYTGMVCIYRARPRSDREPEYAARTAWLLMKDGNLLLFDEGSGDSLPGRKTAVPEAVRKLLLDLLFSQENSNYAFRIDVAGDAAAFRANPLSETAFDWFFPRGMGDWADCNFARGVNDAGSCHSDVERRAVTAFGQRYCTVMLVEDRTTYSMEMPIPGQEVTYASFIWRNGRAVPVSFTDIFGSGDLADGLIRDAFRRADPESCNAPYEIDGFRLSPEGVYIQLKNRREVPVPLSVLAANAESRWIAPFIE